MEKNVFHIVVPTTKTVDDFQKSSTHACLNKLKTISENSNYQIILDVIDQNKKGLTEIMEDRLHNSIRSDYIIFIHDDLEIHDSFIFEKLVLAHQKYDIVGIAGATSQDYSKQGIPPVWHLSRTTAEDSRGIVSHYIPKGFANAPESHVNSVFFGPTPAEVVVIDGLFMSFKKSSFKNKKLEFDKDFSFHFYDMNLCISAVENNLKIGVYPIFCIHYGLGEYHSDPLWHSLAQKFMNKHSGKKIVL
jgi:GT2 family glycosyltransferase